MEVNVLLSVTIVPVLIVILNIIVFDEAVYYEIFLPGYIDDWIFSQSGNFFFVNTWRRPSLTEKGEQFLYTNTFILCLALALDLLFLLTLTINVFCCSSKVFKSPEYANLRYLGNQAKIAYSCENWN